MLPKGYRVTKIHHFVLAERKLKVRSIAETVGISKDRMGRILREILGAPITSAIVRPLYSNVWRCLNTIRRSFRIITWPSMKRRSTGTLWRSKNSRGNRFHRTCSEEGKFYSIGQKLDRTATFVFYFFGIHKVQSTSINGRRTKRPQGSAMPNYWENSQPNCMKKYLILWRKKCSFSMPTHWLAPPTPPTPIGRINLRKAVVSTVFSIFVLERLLFFPNLKKSVAGQKIYSNAEVIAGIEVYFADLKKTYLLDELKQLKHRSVKRIEVTGDYVEEFSFFFCKLSSYQTALVYLCVPRHSFLCTFRPMDWRKPWPLGFLCNWVTIFAGADHSLMWKFEEGTHIHACLQVHAHFCKCVALIFAQINCNNLSFGIFGFCA